jgi:hypothetical protein
MKTEILQNAIKSEGITKETFSLSSGELEQTCEAQYLHGGKNWTVPLDSLLCIFTTVEIDANNLAFTTLIHTGKNPKLSQNVAFLSWPSIPIALCFDSTIPPAIYKVIPLCD